MKNILVANQKGGVGKSFCADEIAFSLERSGIPYSFYDLDSQGGTLHKTKEDPDAEVSVIDTPGAYQKELADWIKAADVIVIPARTTSRDIEPLLRMRKAVLSNGHGKPVIYVLNCFSRFRASRDFKEWFGPFAATGCEVVTIPQSEAAVQAGAAGKSVAEYAKRGKIVDAVLDFVNTVRKAAGLPEEAG